MLSSRFLKGMKRKHSHDALNSPLKRQKAPAGSFPPQTNPNSGFSPGPYAHSNAITQPTSAGPQVPPPSPTLTTARASGVLPQLRKTGRTMLNGFKNSMKALEKGSNMCPPLKSALSEIIACIDAIHISPNNQDAYEKMANELKMMAQSLAEYYDCPGSESSNAAVSRIMRSIEEESASIAQRRAQGTIRRAFDSNQDDIFIYYRRIEALFRQLQADVMLRSWQTTNEQFRMLLLERISPANNARYNSGYSTTIKRRGCTTETREQVQADLQEWVQDPNGAKVYWMNGMAGTGKTTIAYSLCEWLEANQLLGASFFCSRLSLPCKSLNQIIPTIAHQLAQYSTAFQFALCKTLKKDPHVGALNVVLQFKKLVKEPLMEIKHAMPSEVVVVIDALDECQDGYGVQLILEVLLRHAANLPLKFFVASRPETRIISRMNAPGGYTPHILFLHDIDQLVVEQDIQKYLGESLGIMKPAPFQEQIERLAKQAGKLFIYAATVVRYIVPEDGLGNSAARLKAMLTPTSQSISSNTRYRQLDELYSTILGAVFSEELEPEERASLDLVLRTAVCAKELVNASTLALLLGLPEQDVLFALQPLQSVLHLSQAEGLVSTLHTSFPDYMLNQSRSGRFYCNEGQQSELLAQRCFEVMKTQLRFNICDLESSLVPDRDVPNLGERVDKAIGPALFYACQYWADHLRLSSSPERVHAMLSNFLFKRLLFWIEAMNLKRCIGRGEQILYEAQLWLSEKGVAGDTNLHVIDARNFITMFASSACSASTCHLYLSAVEFFRRASSVDQHYRARIHGGIRVGGSLVNINAQGALATWKAGSPVRSVAASPNGAHIVAGCGDGSVRVWEANTGRPSTSPSLKHTGWVSSVAFSHDGTLMVSGSRDMTVQVWSVSTGALVAGPFQGHTDSVYSVTFSPNGTRVASGSFDKTIRVWNVRTGELDAKPFTKHTGIVHSVAFSPNGALIASGSRDTTIRVWDARTGDSIVDPIQGHTGAVYSATFSFNAALIVSGSEDRTIRVWAATTGRLAAGPFLGHTDSVYSVAFCLDDARIVSGSADRTIRVWGVRAGELVAGPFTDHTGPVRSVILSPDGTRIISGSYDKTIRVWDLQTSNPISTLFQGRKRAILSIAFSPDGTCIASGSDDKCIYVWNVFSGEHIAGPFEGHTASVYSLAFSPDGRRLVSGSSDAGILVRDAQTGNITTSQFKGHRGTVYSVAFSPDGALIVSGSLDKTIRVWDVSTGALAAGPFTNNLVSAYPVAFSPDGARILAGFFEQTLLVQGSQIPCADLHFKSLLQRHENSVYSIALSSGGTRMVSGSNNGTIQVWDIHNEDLDAEPNQPDTQASRKWSSQIDCLIVGPSHGHPARVNALAFSPNDIFIASGSGDSTIWVWDAGTVDPFSLMTQGCASRANHISSKPESHSPLRSTASGSSSGVNVTQELEAGSQSESSIVGASAWNLNSNGWLDIDNKLLFWVPPGLLDFFINPRALTVIHEHGSLTMDYSNMMLGQGWAKCYVDTECD